MPPVWEIWTTNGSAYWLGTGTNSTTTGTTTTGTTGWGNWIVNSSTSTTSLTYANLNVWNNWISMPTTSMHVQRYPSRPSYAPPLPVTEEDRRRHRRLSGIRRAKHLRADQRARELLLSVLDDEQKKTLHHQRAFIVCGKGGRRFKVEAHKRQHNIFELNEAGIPIREYCAHAPHDVPNDDNLVCQVLMLQADLEHFEQVANVWDLASPQRPIVSHSGEQLVAP